MKTKRLKAIPIKELGESGDFLNWMKMDPVGDVKDFEHFEQLLKWAKEDI